MSNVNLTIGGRNYTVACGPGEEQHIAALGREIDARMQAIPGIASQSEPRALLFAALFLADELHEARKSASAVQASAPAPQTTAEEDQAVAETLEHLAGRLEMLASRLEG